MKKLLLISAGLLALACVSCSRLASYTAIPFVYFPTSSISVYEDAGEISIPVKALSEVPFTLTFETEDGTKHDAVTGLDLPNGRKGVDYLIEDDDVSLIRFEAGDTLKTLKVKIVDFPNVLTGNKDFTIRLTGSGNEVCPGGFSYCKVTIIDNDHPLKDIFGEYTATDADGNVWTMTFAADPDDWYTTRIDGLLPCFAGNYVGQGLRHYVPATVSQDLSNVSVNFGYKLAESFNDHDVIVYGYDGTYVYSGGTATFEKTKDGYKLDGNRGFAAIYQSGGGLYLAASNALAMAPITLVKK